MWENLLTPPAGALDWEREAQAQHHPSPPGPGKWKSKEVIPLMSSPEPICQFLEKKRIVRIIAESIIIWFYIQYYYIIGSEPSKRNCSESAPKEQFFARATNQLYLQCFFPLQFHCFPPKFDLSTCSKTHQILHTVHTWLDTKPVKKNCIILLKSAPSMDKHAKFTIAPSRKLADTWDKDPCVCLIKR